MGRPKKDAGPPPKNQQTLAQSQVRAQRKKAEHDAQQTTPEQQQVHDMTWYGDQPCDLLPITEASWSNISAMYADYKAGSPLILAGAEESTQLGGTTTTSAVRQSSRLGSSSRLMSTQAGGPSDSDGPDNWESQGLQFVSEVGNLLTSHRPLSITLQEYLIHMVLNHSGHTSDLSQRALRLLMTNAKHHPPSKRGPNNSVIVNTALWTPIKSFAFKDCLCPLALTGRSTQDVYRRYQQLWRHTMHYCGVTMMPVCATSLTEHDLGLATVPGCVLLLSYCQHVIHVDLEVRLGMLEGAGRHPRAHQLITNSLLWKLLALPGATSMINWTLTTHHHVALVRHMVATLIETTQAGAGISAPGQTTANHVGHVGHVGALAAQALHDLGRLCIHADNKLSALYSKDFHKGTDGYYLCKELLELITGKDLMGRDAKDMDVSTKALVAKLKPPGAKLRLLNALSLEMRLLVLAVHLVGKLECTWHGDVVTLPDHMQRIKEYQETAGMLRQVQVDPVELLSQLVPVPAQATVPATPGTPLAVTQEEEAGPSQQQQEEEPSTGKACKRARKAPGVGASGADLFGMASRTVFMVGGGFDLWLASFLPATLELMSRTTAGSEQVSQRASLKDVLERLELRRPSQDLAAAAPLSAGVLVDEDVKQMDIVKLALYAARMAVSAC